MTGREVHPKKSMRITITLELFRLIEVKVYPDFLPKPCPLLYLDQENRRVINLVSGNRTRTRSMRTLSDGPTPTSASAES